MSASVKRVFEFEFAGTGSSRATQLLFSITGVSGDIPASYAVGFGEFFAAHIAGFSGANGVTSAQFAGSTLVPLPAALTLFGSALNLMRFIGWRIRITKKQSEQLPGELLIRH